MHTHPLHRDIHIECECCRLVQLFRLTSKYDQLVCKECNRHVGNSTPKILQRSQDHLTI